MCSCIATSMWIKVKITSNNTRKWGNWLVIMKQNVTIIRPVSSFTAVWPIVAVEEAASPPLSSPPPQGPAGLLCCVFHMIGCPVVTETVKVTLWLLVWSSKCQQHYEFTEQQGLFPAWKEVYVHVWELKLNSYTDSVQYNKIGLHLTKFIFSKAGCCALKTWPWCAEDLMSSKQGLKLTSTWSYKTFIGDKADLQNRETESWPQCHLVLYDGSIVVV